MDDSRAIPSKWKQIPAGNPQNTNDGPWQVPGKGEGPSFPFKMQMDNCQRERKGIGSPPLWNTDGWWQRRKGSPSKCKWTTERETSLALRNGWQRGGSPFASKRQMDDGRGGAQHKKEEGCSSACQNQDNAMRRGKPSLRLFKSTSGKHDVA